MRFTEVLKVIRNTFIRKKAKIKPEGNIEVTEQLEVSEVPETVTEMAKGKKRDDLEGKIRRYRAFAYHHRKKRMRKKYLKKLLDISPIDRFVHMVNQGGISLHTTWSNGHVIGVDYSTQKDFSPGYIGNRKIDHGDSRMKGGIR